MRQQLRTIARAPGIPYEMLSGDASQVTFASGRHIPVYQFCRPVWLAWVRLATVGGVLPGAPSNTRM